MIHSTTSLELANNRRYPMKVRSVLTAMRMRMRTTTTRLLARFHFLMDLVPICAALLCVAPPHPHPPSGTCFYSQNEDEGLLE